MCLPLQLRQIQILIGTTDYTENIKSCQNSKQISLESSNNDNNNIHVI